MTWNDFKREHNLPVFNCPGCGEGVGPTLADEPYTCLTPYPEPHVMNQEEMGTAGIPWTAAHVRCVPLALAIMRQAEHKEEQGP